VRTPKHMRTRTHTGQEEKVELVIPAKADMLFITRMIGAAVASRTDFGYDRVEDLRLALDEMCLALLDDHPGGGSLKLEFSWSDDTIDVSAALSRGGDLRARAAGRPDGRPATEIFEESSPLSHQIIEAIADQHGRYRDDHTAHHWLRMFAPDLPTGREATG
jgi:anti-sigma regulatory factor (Ser/Thr protein kinase)